MDGIIVLHKKSGYTSNDALNKIKRILNPKKIGHAGTLDPLASGVLVVLLNGATKLSDIVMSNMKKYAVSITIGVATDTYDADGSITDKVEVIDIATESIDNILNSFMGKSKQLPPMHSAIKKDGMKLYDLARRGVEVERKLRDIEVFEIYRTTDVVMKNSKCHFSFDAVVSKGTYIRSLCVDIGSKLGYPAHMSDLVRISSGKFKLEDSCTIEDIESGNYHVIPMLEALSDLPKYDIKSDEMYKKIFNGMSIKAQDLNVNDDVIVMQYNNKLLAIYYKDDNVYRADKVWN